MTTREYTDISKRDAEAKSLVDDVANKNFDALQYRAIMTRIGHKLGGEIAPKINASPTNDVYVICTVEDADYLARGVIDELDKAGLGNRVRLICLWNEKVRQEGVSLSPILKQYAEEPTGSSTTFIVVKSIISGACVVKTNITRALSLHNPDQVFVASPVLLKGAQDRLEVEFPKDVATKFNYVWLATDTDKKGDDVLPGIGGSVYERLGLGDEDKKNSYLPEIVRERRKQRFMVTA